MKFVGVASFDKGAAGVGQPFEKLDGKDLEIGDDKSKIKSGRHVLRRSRSVAFVLHR